MTELENRSYTLTIVADAYGNQKISMTGNLTVAEVVFGLEMAQKAVLEKAQGLGMSQLPRRIDFVEPKRF